MKQYIYIKSWNGFLPRKFFKERDLGNYYKEYYHSKSKNKHKNSEFWIKRNNCVDNAAHCKDASRDYERPKVDAGLYNAQFPSVHFQFDKSVRDNSDNRCCNDTSDEFSRHFRSARFHR